MRALVTSVSLRAGASAGRCETRTTSCRFCFSFWARFNLPEIFCQVLNFDGPLGETRAYGRVIGNTHSAGLSAPS